MADKDLTITCEVVASKVEVGSGKKDTNEIVLKITNTSAEPIAFSGPGARGEFSIAISVGVRPEDLVASAGDSTAINIPPPNGWQPNPYKNLEGQATWSFRLPRTVLAAKDTAQLKLTNFESHTDPGKAKVTIGAKVSGYGDYGTVVDVEKKAEQFELLYFTADPPYIITDDDRNNFKLTWNTVKAKRAVLYSNNAQLQEFDTAGVKYSKENPSFTTIYKLVATDEASESNRKEQQVTVQVLTPGWHKVAFFRYGNPSMLCNMNGVKLYGIFIKDGKASLYSSKYPLSAWTLENSFVPPGMQTSPAVCFRNKLWLIGGSSADPNLRSNEIWCYESDPGEWKKQEKVPPKFTARMGHACVVFDNKLLVLGGNDQTGTSVNEVWVAKNLNGDQLEWEPEPYRAPWQPRCMFAATVFNKKIWIYGGAKEPFGEPFENIWSSSDQTQWQEYKVNPPEGKPIGCALQEVKGKLNLIAALRRENSVVARKCVLTEVQQLWRSSEIPEAAWLDQAENTFSLISVEHRGLVYLIWQDYKIYQAKSGQLFLNVYLP